MEPTKNHIVMLLMAGLLIFFLDILIVLKWAGVSNVRFYASLTGALLILFLIVALLKTHYKLLFK